ncbi:pectin acetylesterase 8-like [Silene latifolia]|uniref:pectin acetylesterase 8-like n=1 Tax=Silene latifolia TaxID=37657 RepID=UPI003D76FA95
MRNSSKWLRLLVCIVILMKVDGFDVPITIVEDAVAKGSVCLDGSPPAYHFDKGFDSGVNNWLIYMQGGAWCNNATTCLDRSQTHLGSSKLMSTNYYFTGILSNKSKHNPDFYNWNRVKVRYCDGSSYTGDVDAVDPNTKIFYRGARVWRAVMDDLLAKGMKNARNAVLAGCSAGGLGAILQCDNFRALFPSGAKVKCLSDAGVFINTEAISGTRPLEELYAEVVTTHGSAKNLPEACTSKFSPELCMLPQYAARYIQTPLFLLNSAYDAWQISNILIQGVVDADGKWRNCLISGISRCSDSQNQALKCFKKQFLAGLSTICDNNPTTGFFINSCFCHCQSDAQETWLSDDSPRLDNTVRTDLILLRGIVMRMSFKSNS